MDIIVIAHTVCSRKMWLSSSFT